MTAKERAREVRFRMQYRQRPELRESGTLDLNMAVKAAMQLLDEVIDDSR